VRRYVSPLSGSFRWSIQPRDSVWLPLWAMVSPYGRYVRRKTAAPAASVTAWIEPRRSVCSQNVVAPAPGPTRFAITPSPSAEMYFVTTPFVIS
jgi:hypothetical protein